VQDPQVIKLARVSPRCRFHGALSGKDKIIRAARFGCRPNG
jgi:hypothetical protein